MNHSVSDLLIRIKNSSLAKRREVVLPYSKINFEIGKTLVREGYLEDIKEVKEGNKKSLTAVIKYDKRIPVLTDLIIVSKPSLRVYKATDEIAAVERRGKHKVVLSTSKGVMSGDEARKNKVGGELLFEIW